MTSQNSAQPPPRVPSNLMLHIEVNHKIGELIGFLTLAILSLIALLKIPSFIRYRIRAISRPSSFKSKGYFLSKADASNTKAPCNTSAIETNSNSHPSANGAVSSAILGAKWKLNRLSNVKIPRAGAFLGDLKLGNMLLMLAYMIILLILSLYKNTYDGITVSKYRRFGYIAISQFPLSFALAMKNSPLTFVIGVGYEKLNFFHRFVGRMIFVFAVVHASLQMRLQYELSGAIHFKGPTLTGLIGLCALASMALMGIKFIRNSIYQIFLIVHILGYLTVIVALWKHTESTHPYLAASIAFLGFDYLSKTLKSRVKRATFTKMPAGLTRIEIEGINEGWRAGQHIFIRVLKGRNIFEKHPFTIANAPNSSTPYGSTGHLLLVVKAAGDFTQRIHRLAGQPRRGQLQSELEKSDTCSQGRTDVECTAETLTEANAFTSSDVSHRVIVDGPYGTFFTDMTRYGTVLLCAGGSGFTYCMATLEDIIGAAAKSGACLTKHVVVVWSLREPDMHKCFSRDIEETIRVSQHCGINVTMKIFFTKGGGGPMFVNRSVEFHFGRPNLVDIIGEVINGKATSSNGGVGVGACGPLGLVDSVVEGVNGLDPERVKQIGGIKLHTERFGW